MYCPNCGKKISKNVKYCPYCGHSLDKNFNNINLHHIEKKLTPKSSTHNVNLHDLNPKRIPTDAKILFGILISAAIIIGGYHHYHYKQTPASVNIAQQINNKNYKSNKFCNEINSLTGGTNLTQSDENKIKQDYINFNNGNVSLHNNNMTFPSKSNSSDGYWHYSIKGKNMKLKLASDNHVNSDNPCVDMDLKLVHASENHKELTFNLASVSDIPPSGMSSKLNQKLLNKFAYKDITFKQS